MPTLQDVFKQLGSQQMAPSPAPVKKKSLVQTVQAMAPPPVAQPMLDVTDPFNQKKLDYLGQRGYSKQRLDLINNQEDLNKLVDETTRSETVRTPGSPLITEPQFIGAKNMMERNPFPGQVGQMRVNADMENTVNQIKNNIKPEWDLSAIASGLDQLFGSKLAQSYKAPKTLLDKQALLASLQDKLQGNYNAQSHFENTLFNSLKTPPEITTIVAGNKASNTAQTKYDTKESVQAGTPPAAKGGIDEKALERLAKSLGEVPAQMQSILSRAEQKIGPFSGNSEIPGTGMVTKLLPDFLSSKDAVAVRQDLGDLMALKVLARSGKAASDEERRQIQSTIGTLWGQGPEAIRRGFINEKNEIVNIMKSKEAGFNKATLQERTNRGGILSNDINSIGGASAPDANKHKDFESWLNK